MKFLFSITTLATFVLFASSCGHSSSEEIKHVKDAQHAIIYYQQGRFAGWPANNGAFIFDNDEIVTGFTEATYKKTNSHNSDKPYLNWLARSTDGGSTWTAADPDNYAGDFGDRPELQTITAPVNYRRPGFAMRVVGEGYHGANDGRAHFFYSYDAGKTWNGPYGFGDLLSWPELTEAGFDELTPRTDYIVNDSSHCLLFLSARKKGVFASDRLFCIETTDGGQTYSFLGWVVGPAGTSANPVKVDLFEDPNKNPGANECRAVMSQSQKLDDGTLVSVIRRKFIVDGEGTDKHWIDAYASTDGGKTWHFVSKIADTGYENGNPPAFALTKDGRLCVVYGERAAGTIRVVYSADKGKTWSQPEILMDGFWSEDMQLNDLGYPRVVCRSDGKMVAMYYYSTKENPHHLRATIWEP
ncbi:MAG: exo-alpha-sialidase [Chitinophagaceae bacterium]|nr:exo-alpha-sialidase [Chitinophagaceae bacterium]MCW5928356.1 exo-alpha-sialidase [Chitinophagaceae bacterium]